MSETIVFCDTENQELDEIYAEKCRKELRKQMGWEVKKGTKSYDAITEFSKGYSRDKRDVTEVVGIFRIASGLIKFK